MYFMSYRVVPFDATLAAPGHLPGACRPCSDLDRTPWLPATCSPAVCGLYEVLLDVDAADTALQSRELVLLQWNGRLWIDGRGTAVAATQLQAAWWRGLTRPSYESACLALGIRPVRPRAEEPDLFLQSGHAHSISQASQGVQRACP